MTLHALILAGSRPAGTPGSGDPVAEVSGVRYKAFAPIGGKAMLTYVLETLGRSPHIAHITVALPRDIDMEAEARPAVPDTIADKVTLALASTTPAKTVSEEVLMLPADASLLVTTADHPLLTTEMIEDFVMALEENTDVAAALIPLSQVYKTYPHTKRTGLKFSDGRYSGCNIFFFSGKEAVPLLTFWRKLESYRKQPWRMAMMIGLGMLFRYLLGRLSLREALDHLQRRTSVNLQSVTLQQPEAAIDVDSTADMALVTQILQERQKF